MKNKWKSLLSAVVLSAVVAQGPAATVQADGASAARMSTAVSQMQQQGSIELEYEGRSEFRLKENEIRLGDTGTFSLEGVKASNVQWRVSRPSVLSVDSQGGIETKRAGSCAVTATYRVNGRTRTVSRNIVVVSRWDAEKSKFPSGTYWNNSHNPDKVTLKPCNHKEDCSSYIYEVNIAGDSLKASQCHGFALKVAADIYGRQDLAHWRKYTSYHGVSVGDVVRIYNQTHTIIITKVYGNSVEYADCNNGDTCQITWGHVMSKDTLRSVYNYSYTQG